jgi:recombinase-like zinc beta ribbon protein
MLSLRPGSHEGYVDWARSEAIRKLLASNLSGANQAGAAKRGASLLAGLMRCRRCGRKMIVNYTGQKHDTPRYACLRGRLDSGEPPCISFGGIGVDDAIEDELLRVLEPGAKRRWKQISRRRSATMKSWRRSSATSRRRVTRRTRPFVNSMRRTRLSTCGE